MTKTKIAIGTVLLCASIFQNNLCAARMERHRFISQFLKKGDVGAEIGVDYGIFSAETLLTAEPRKLYLIDPYIYGLQSDVEKSDFVNGQIDRDRVYQQVKRMFEEFSHVVLIREKSEDAHRYISDNELDYVYIDGLHSFEAVLSDLRLYHSKVKPGGFLLGDDYGWTGVKEAVAAFLSEQPDCELLNNPYAMESVGQFVIRKWSIQ